MPRKTDAPVDPRPGEKWNHRDGGTIYVIHRTPRMVFVSGRPDYYRQVDTDVHWVRLSTFTKMTIGRRQP